jgi:asparagine synthase (glutamine-hydrolysing)
MVADVPVGILLSGGLDSSLVTAMAVRARPSVKTFTVRFPGYKEHDETDHARLIARHFGTDHVELEVAEATPDLLAPLARQFDEPVVDSSMIPTFLLSRLIRQHCTVALGGDGGDELFGGYQHYDRMLWMQRRARLVPAFVRAQISTSAERWLPIGLKGRNWLKSVGSDLRTGVPHVAAQFDRLAREQMIPSATDRVLIAEEIWNDRLPVSENLLQRATRMDFENYFAEDILVKVDRASMLNSLEVRAPLLDYRIIEFAFARVPSHLKATATNRKILLKRLSQRLLPQEFNRQRKQGFSIPLGHWLQGGPWLDYFRDVLLSDANGIFDRKFVEDLFAGQAKGRNNAERLFSLVLFELWRKEYRVALG